MPQPRALLLASFLTWIAGYVDAVGFLCLNKIYTANMSGNSVSIGIDLVSQNWIETARRVTPVAAYVIGLLFCRLLVQFAARQHIRSVASLAFLCETALLIPVALILPALKDGPLGMSLALITLLAVAMGIQNAALTHFSSLTVHTGFVTGTLVKCMEQVAKYLACLWDELHHAKAGLGQEIINSFRWKEFRLGAWLAFIWTAYVIGAVCGAFGKFQFNARALFLPVVCIASLIVVDLRHPLAIQEEELQEKA